VSRCARRYSATEVPISSPLFCNSISLFQGNDRDSRIEDVNSRNLLKISKDIIFILVEQRSCFPRKSLMRLISFIVLFLFIKKKERDECTKEFSIFL